MAIDAGVLQTIKDQLESLRRTPDGAFLYRIVVRALDKYGVKNGRIELAFMAFLYSVLGKYIRDPSANASTRMKAKFIQQRLRIYLPPEWVSKNETGQVNSGTDNQRKRRASSANQTYSAAGAHDASRDAGKNNPLANASRDTVQGELTHRVTDNGVSDDGLNLSDIVNKSKEFNSLLKSNLRALKLAESPDDLMELKQLLVKGMEDLVRGHETISDDISATGSFVKSVGRERKRLKQEMQALRKHGAVDGLTGLPKRDVFIHQLEAEIGRAKRYGFSLAITLIEIDDLVRVNQNYGPAAGEEVLQCYAKEIFSRFRSYDVIARYDNDAFAILLPNTQKDGAYKALEKAQKSVANIIIHHEGNSFSMPSFTSVLAIYAQGENPDALLKRASDALEMARQRSRGQVVISLPSQ